MPPLSTATDIAAQPRYSKEICVVILAGGQALRMRGEDKALMRLEGKPMLAHCLNRLEQQLFDKQVRDPQANIQQTGLQQTGLQTDDYDAVSLNIALNTGAPSEAFQVFDLPIIPDACGGFLGPLAGILSGMEWAATQGAETVVSIAVDTPFFPKDLVARLVDAQRKNASPLAQPLAPSLATCADEHGQLQMHPTFGCWPVALRHDLRQSLQDGHRKLRSWARAHGAVEVAFERQHSHSSARSNAHDNRQIDAGLQRKASQDLDPFFNINTPEDLTYAARIIRGE